MPKVADISELSFLIVLSVFSSISIEQNNYIGIYQTTIVFFVSNQLSGNYLNMQVVIYFPHLKTSDQYLLLPYILTLHSITMAKSLYVLGYVTVLFLSL